MTRTCEYILTNNRYCKNYCKYGCNINKIHNICNAHAIMVLGKYAEKIQNVFKRRKLLNKVILFKKLPIDLKLKIVFFAVNQTRFDNVYSLYGKFISKRINISLNTIDWYKLFYTRYVDVYHYFTDNDSLSSFCRLLELIKKYFPVIKNKVNLKNIKTICEELKKIYYVNLYLMTRDNVIEWTYVISIIDQLPLFKKKSIIDKPSSV